MKVNVVCPACHDQFEVNRDLVGKRMRCPNESCGEIFLARAAEDGAKPPKGPAGYESGEVGEIVPVVMAEVVEAEPVETIEAVEAVIVEPDEGPIAAPPVRGSSKPREVAWNEQQAPPVPREVAWNQQPPPPVRQGAEAKKLAEPPPRPARREKNYAAALEMELAAAAKRRRNKMIIFVMLFLMLGMISAGVYVVITRIGKAEEEKAAEAKKAFDDNRMIEAANKYKDLVANFSSSANRAEYQFMAGLSEARQAADTSTGDPIENADKVKSFSDAEWKEGSPSPLAKKLFAEHKAALEDALTKVTSRLLDEGEAQLGADPPLPDKLARAEQLAKKARELLALLQRHSVAAEPTFRARLDKLDERIRTERDWLATLARIDKILKEPTEEHIEEAERLAIAAGRPPSKNKNVEQKLKLAREALDTQVKWVADPKPARAAAEVVPALLLPPTAGGESHGVFFALANGVLYALDQETGQPRWAVRIGIDSSALPLRAPAGGGKKRNLAVYATTEPLALTARDALTGAAVWQQPLPAAARGRPVLIERRVYVPLADKNGTLAVFDAVSGQQFGRLELKRPLGPAAARAGQRRLYVPAERDSVLVVDVDQMNAQGQSEPALETVLQTNHPAGSLRGQPVLVGEDDAPTNAQFFILTQTDGLDGMKLRVFLRPPPGTTGTVPAELKLELPVKGRAWDAPVCDGEKLALVTDAGEVGLFGVRQVGSQDELLFPLPPVKLPPTQGVAGDRGQVVHLEDRTVWVLVRGVLQQIRLGIDRRAGLVGAAIWEKPPVLGVPLQDAQFGSGRDLLFVVTLGADGKSCLATAVVADTGAIYWQRQLGGQAGGAPALLKGGALGLADSRGGLYRADPAQRKAVGGWRLDDVLVQAPRSDATGYCYLLPLPGKEAGAVAVIGVSGNRVVLRRMTPEGQPAKLNERGEPADVEAVQLPAAPSGEPAVVGGGVVVPLANGTVARVPLVGGPAENGPNWRTDANDPAPAGTVTALGGDDFLLSHGSYTMLRFTWPAGKGYVAAGQQRLEFKMTGPPVVVPSASGPPRIAVADEGGAVRLLLLEGDVLRTERAWVLGGSNGKVTGGRIHELCPCRSGDGKMRLAAVIDRSHLYLIDPDSPQTDPLGSCPLTGAGLAGPPLWLGNQLLAVTLNGQLLRVDATTGQATGAPQALPEGTVPAGALVPFGANRLFLPLADGTALVLPRPGARVGA